jgi:serine/threonine protein phosphatase PrpC
MTDVPAEADESGVYGAAIVGGRSEQQDYFCIHHLNEKGGILLVLADGMGGYPGGDLASKLAVNGFVTAFVTLFDSKASVENTLLGALDAANACVRAAQVSAPLQFAKMGTTLVAAYLSAAGIAWVSVGDSPMWLFRSGRLTRLNEDHSLRQMKLEGARVSGNMLRSAVSGEPIPLVDCHAKPVDLRKNDLVLLASDGILTLSESEISTVLQSNRAEVPRRISHRLLEAVQERGTSDQDNCTVIVVGHSPLRNDPAQAQRSRAVVVAIALLGGLGLVVAFISYLWLVHG